MTDSTEPSGGDPGLADDEASPSGSLRLPPGGSIFTIEGRAAPGLYFVGWIGSIMGLATLLVGTLAGGGSSAIVLTTAGAALLSLGLVAAAGSQAIERRLRAGVAHTVYVGPSPFLVFGASLPLTLLFVIILIAPAVALGLDARSPAASLLSLLATAAVYLGLIRLLVVGPAALTWREMGVGRFRSAALGDLAQGAVLALPILVVTYVLAALLVGVLGTSPESPLPPPGNALGFALNLIAAAIVTPIGEEVFFRGFSTTAWAQGMGAQRGLLRGAIFFAFVHVLTIGGATFGEAAAHALIAFVVRLPVSFALGWVFLQRRSIYASIGLHAMYNGFLVILAELAARSFGG